MLECNKLVQDLARKVKGKKTLTINKQRILENYGIQEEPTNSEQVTKLIKQINLTWES